MLASPESETTAEVVAPRQLTVRAIVTGVVIGALLAPCNIYAGLKIGWQFNMSVSAALLSYAIWQSMHHAVHTPPWGILENNINQTAASAAASIASAGLVAPIPALTMLTGEALPWGLLCLWVLSVSAVGIAVAVGLRRQMLVEDELPFPMGVATAATLKEIYGEGKQAASRIKVLIAGGAAAAALKLVSSFWIAIPKIGPTRVMTSIHGVGVTPTNLGFVVDPSLMMIGFGAIVGIRAGISLLLGTVFAWAFLAPWAMGQGFAEAGEATVDAFWYGSLLEWLLWPGVTLMVTASLTSFAFSWRSVVAALRGRRESSGQELSIDPEEVPRRLFLAGLLVALGLSVAAQVILFGISFVTAILAVLLTFLLAIVAGRVSGETGITPIGAMGKVTQLTFGALSPGNAATNLMAANVTGGAAGQCADLLHDMKTGLLIGASPKKQALAQMFGVVAGSMSGVAAYLVLIPDPAKDLLTDEWPAPAVATWKSVAEVFMNGWDAMPQGASVAMIIAGVAGCLLAALEKLLPPSKAHYVPSAAAVGLAFVIPAWSSLSIFVGAFLVWSVGRSWPNLTARYSIVLAAGLVAGESLAGVASAIHGVLSR